MRNILFALILFFFNDCLFGQLKYIDKIYQGFGGIEGIDNPTSVKISPDGKHLYEIGNKQSIVIFEINPINGDLKFIESVKYDINGPTDMDGIFELEFSKDGGFAYAILMDKHSLIVFERNILSGKLSIIQKITNPETENSLTSVCTISISSDDKFIYTAGLRDNTIGIFKREQTTGKLTFQSKTPTKLSGHQLSWVTIGYHLNQSKDLKNLYISSSWDHAIVTFQRDSITGNLAYLQRIENNVDLTEFYSPKSYIISNDDRFIYTFSSYGIHTLKRNETNGSLLPNAYFELNTFPEPVAYSFWPSSGVFSHDGRNLLVSTNYDNFVFKFKVDPADGAISADTLLYSPSDFIYPEQEIWSNQLIAFSKDDKTAYVASKFQNTLTVIDSRNETTGLAILREIKNGENGLDYFNEPGTMVITHNEKFAFVSSQFDNSITSFSRNKTSGTLNYLKTTFAGKNGTPVLTSISKIILSDDNKYLYSCTQNWYIDSEPDEICVFAIDSASGDIAKLQCIPNEDTDAYGTLIFINMAASFDNQNLYAITEGGIIKKYSRDQSSVALTFNKNISPFGPNVSFSPNKLILSKDNKYAYFIGADAIYVCSRDSGNGDLSLLQCFTCSKDVPNSMINVCNSILSEDQSSIFLLNNYSPSIFEYKRNPDSGLLSFVRTCGENTSIQYPEWISVSSNKNFIYYGAQDQQIGVLRYSPVSKTYDNIATIKGFRSTPNEGWQVSGNLMLTANDRSLYFVSGKDKSITNYRPTLSLGNDIDACEGDTIILTQQNKYKSLQWSVNSQSDTIKVTKTGIFSLTVLNDFGETESDTIEVIFHPLPVPDLGPDIELCLYPKEQIPLGCKLKYKTYSWDTGEKTEQISVNKTGQYIVKVTDIFNCLNTDSINVIVNRYPVVELGDNINICGDDYTIAPEIYPGTTSTWSNGSKNDSIVVYESGIYSLTSETVQGCAETDSVGITIKPYPYLDLGNDFTISQDGSVMLFPGSFDNYYWRCSTQFYSYNEYVTIDSSLFSGTNKVRIFLLVGFNNCYTLDSLDIYLAPVSVDGFMGNAIKIYPNPVKNKLFVEVSKYINEELTIRLYSLKHEILSRNTLYNNKIEIDMMPFPKGVYFLEIKGGEILETGKLLRISVFQDKTLF